MIVSLFVDGLYDGRRQRRRQLDSGGPEFTYYFGGSANLLKTYLNTSNLPICDWCAKDTNLRYLRLLGYKDHNTTRQFNHCHQRHQSQKSEVALGGLVSMGQIWQKRDKNTWTWKTTQRKYKKGFGSDCRRLQTVSGRSCISLSDVPPFVSG